MRRLQIVKTGSALPSLVARRGDYEDWIAAGVGPDSVEVTDVERGDVLPDPALVRAPVVITGSSAMVTDAAEWSEETARWLAPVVRRGVPVLGICYGHQLLCRALGGAVDKNPHGREMGAVEVSLNEAGLRDPLLGSLGCATLRVNSSHREHARRLPPGAQVLAHNAADPHQAAAYAERVWGLQFHPEWDADVICTYLESRVETLAEEGFDPEAMLAKAVPSEHGAQILRRFGELAFG